MNQQVAQQDRGDGVRVTVDRLAGTQRIDACRRMRLTAEGILYLCLLGNCSVDIRPIWSNGGLLPDKADMLMRPAVAAKVLHGSTQATQMATLGG